MRKRVATISMAAVEIILDNMTIYAYTCQVGDTNEHRTFPSSGRRLLRLHRRRPGLDRQSLVPGLHRLCRAEPRAVRLHELVSDDVHPSEGRPARWGRSGMSKLLPAAAVSLLLVSAMA